MTAHVISIHKDEAALWESYVALAQRAQRTGRLEDGIAAGRAWARFLKAFEGQK